MVQHRDQHQDHEIVKAQRLAWLAEVYSGQPQALSDDAADEHLFDRTNDFGLANFLETYRPLKKLRAARGEAQFTIAEVEHKAPSYGTEDLFSNGKAVLGICQVAEKNVLVRGVGRR